MNSVHQTFPPTHLTRKKNADMPLCDICKVSLSKYVLILPWRKRKWLLQY